MSLKSLLLGLAACAALGASARFTAEEALLSAPIDVISPLSARTARELVEYARAGMTDRVERNLLHGEASLPALAADSLTLVTDSARTLRLYLLPAAKADTVIAMVETFRTSAGTDGRLTLWSRSWQPLPALWAEPRAAEWLTPQGRKSRADFERAVPFIVAGYSFDPATGVLTLTNHTAPVLSLEVRDRAMELMRPALRYRWTPKGFKPLKDAD